MTTNTYFRNAQAGIPGNGGNFAPQHRDAGTAVLDAPTAGGLTATESRAFAAKLESGLNDAQQGAFLATDVLEDGRESGRAHALAETYARLLFDEDDTFDYSAEGETLLNERHNGDRSSFDLQLDVDGRHRSAAVSYLRGRAAEAFTKATSGDEVADVASFHSGEYETFEELADELEGMGGAR